MRYLKHIFEMYVRSSTHVAFSVVCFVCLTCYYVHIVPKYSYLIFVFFGTIFTYNFTKYGTTLPHSLQPFSDRLKSVFLYTILCFIGVLVLAFFQSFKIVVLSCIAGVLSVLYTNPLYKGKNFRNIPFIKIFFVAVLWTYVTVLMPFVNNNLVFDQDFFVLCMKRFLVVLVLLLPFEIRDLSQDPHNLKTIPQLMGVRKTKFFGIALLCIVTILETLYGISNSNYFAWIAYFIFIITALLLLFSSERKSFYYSAFWVESIPVFWLLMVLLFDEFF